MGKNPQKQKALARIHPYHNKKKSAVAIKAKTHWTRNNYHSNWKIFRSYQRELEDLNYLLNLLNDTKEKIKVAEDKIDKLLE